MGKKVRVLIADDHEIFADALRTLLEKTYEVINTVHDGRSMVKCGLDDKPDVIVVDFSMPLLNGLDAAKRIREQVPSCRFVFLTMYEDPNLACAVLELQPVGFVLKHSAASELVNAIAEVVDNRTYLPHKFRSMDWVAIKSRSQKFIKPMSKRQRDVLQLLAEGRSLKQAAFHLNLSQKTIEFHKHAIMQSFNIKNNAELVLFALKQGLIGLEHDL